MKARYVNPFTDFGFKKLFGEESSKPLLMNRGFAAQEVETMEIRF